MQFLGGMKNQRGGHYFEEALKSVCGRHRRCAARRFLLTDAQYLFRKTIRHNRNDALRFDSVKNLLRLRVV